MKRPRRTSTFKRDLALYLGAHRNRWNLLLHYFAFLFAFLGWAALFVNLRAVLAFAFAHYVLSWVGHYGFERNQPASFKYPWIGFYVGFSWFFLRTFELLTGRRVIAELVKGES